MFTASFEILAILSLKEILSDESTPQFKHNSWPSDDKFHLSSMK